MSGEGSAELGGVTNDAKVGVDQLPKNLEHKIQFTASTQPDERQRILERITSNAQDTKQALDYLSGDTKSLTETESQTIQTLIEKARSKLESIGIATAAELLPGLEQILIRESSSKHAIQDGGADQYGGYVEFSLPKGMDFSSPDFQLLFFHEIAHFVTKVVVQKNHEPEEGEEDFNELATGFNRVPAKKVERGNRIIPPNFDLGIYEESTAELFSLFCLDNNRYSLTLDVANGDQVPFMMSFLQEFANRTNSSPLETFKKLFKAKVQRDFSIQREMVAVFGTDVVRDINNIKTNWDYVLDKEKLHEIAKRGGFDETYSNYLGSLDQGEHISFPGIKGSILSFNTGFK